MLSTRRAALALVFGGWMVVVSADSPLEPQQSAPRTPGELQPGKTSIHGRVVEGGTTSGVAGAVVMLTSSALGNAEAIFSNGIAGGPRRIAADAQGNFLFRELPPGVYRVTASAPGYADGAYGDDRVIQVRRSLDLMRSIEIVDTDGLVRVNVPLFRRGGISGRVVDEAGEAIVGAQVMVTSYAADWSGPVIQPAGSSRTDDRGAYHVDVPPGDYVLSVLAPTTTVPVSVFESRLDALRMKGVPPAAFEANMASQPALTQIDGFMVTQPGTLAGVPAISTGNPPRFYPTTFHPSHTSLAQAAVVRIGSGEERQGVDIQMRPHRLTRLSGQLAGLTGPAGNVLIWLVPDHPTVHRTSPASTIGLLSATADENGQFTFIGIVPGQYLLYASKPANDADQTAGYALSKITVGTGDVQDVRIVLEPGARIRGRVAFEGAAPPSAEIIRRIIVSLRPVPGSLAAMRPAGGIPVDPGGAFTSHELAPSPYGLSVTPPPGWTLRSIMVANRDAADRPVELTSAGLNDVVVTLTSGRTSLAGTVRGIDGPGGAPVTVVVFPTDKSLWRQPGMASRRVQTAAPGRDGRFVFPTLPAGEYFLVATTWPAADYSDAAVLTRAIPFATRVLLTEGQTMSQDVRVETGK